MIKTVIKLENNMVMVFDEYGEEMPEYQGYYRCVKNRIIANAPSDAVFKHWFGYALQPHNTAPDAW